MTAFDEAPRASRDRSSQDQSSHDQFSMFYEGYSIRLAALGRGSVLRIHRMSDSTPDNDHVFDVAGDDPQGAILEAMMIVERLVRANDPLVPEQIPGTTSPQADPGQTSAARPQGPAYRF